MLATPERSRWLALVVLCVGMLMIVLDVTVVNVALPSIQRDLHFSQANLAWVVNAYLLTFGGLLLLAGRMGDLFSRRRVFLVGLAIFTVASLLCGIAQTQAMLIAARFLQGLGGAMTSAVILGMIVTMFPDPRDQAKAIGVFSFVASAGGSIGLLAGGLVTQALNWHWIFFINLPVGVATAMWASRLLPRDRGRGLVGGADVTGAVLITGGLMLAVYAIVKPAAEYGWTATQTLVAIGAAVTVLTAFVVRQATARNPLIPLGILHSRNLAGTNAIQMLTVPAMFGMFFLGSLYLQRVLGYDALHIGLAFLPLTVLMGTLSLGFTDRLTIRFGARNTLICGFLLVAAGLAVLTQLPVRGAYMTDILPAVILFGIGAGIAFPALMTLAMSGATPDNAGLASGLVNTTAQIGGALGLAVLATLASTRTHQLALSGQSPATALTQGYRLAFLIALGLIAVAIAMAAVVLRHSPQIENNSAREPEGSPDVLPGVETPDLLVPCG
ncbi:MAG TPA: MFS transporter [Acidimicrobiales bacterium]|nr:MFS transporter [Acidimicrobiales bacterium]